MTLRGLGLLLALFSAISSARAAAPPPDTARSLAAKINRLVADHWRNQELSPAPRAEGLTLLRRVTLDLAGRVPTESERAAFRTEGYESAVARLMRSPEFSHHFASVLDEQLQGPFAGNDAFRAYLREALRQRKGWDVVFREIMVGPWKDKAVEPARHFLQRRARDLDQLTTDTARSFFGVDISCARCHDHPLVKDWKREHYFGLAAFLVRTTGGRGGVGEKPDGEARYAGPDGKDTVAAMMFLSGRTVTEPSKKAGKAAPFSRREALVRVALEERRFLARALVNRVWQTFHGRGLVDPPDQLHSANPPSIPALLDFLTDDFIAHGHDVPRLVAGIVLSRPYQLASQWGDKGPVPDAAHFAVARLRPLSPRQFARSLLVVIRPGTFQPTQPALEALDKEAAPLLADLAPTTGPFHATTREALFLSNAESLRKKLAPAADNLTSRLVSLPIEETVIRQAVLAVWGRPARDEEVSSLGSWLKRHPAGREAACEDLIWALLTSAEFRFNH